MVSQSFGVIGLDLVPKMEVKFGIVSRRREPECGGKGLGSICSRDAEPHAQRKTHEFITVQKTVLCNPREILTFFLLHPEMA